MKNKIKHLLLAISTIILSQAAMAQTWSGSGSATGDAYRTGNVGIGLPVSGVPTPEKPLHVLNAGDAAIRLQALNGSGRRWDLLSSGGASLINSGYFGIIDITNNLPRLVINHIGHVGLGTADMPERRLHIKDATDAYIRLQATDNNGQRWDILSSGGGSLLNSGDFGIIDVPNNKVRLAINRSGNVGIGFDDAGSTYKLAVNGKVKIGTLAPQTTHSDAMLAVDGKIVSKSLYVTSLNWADFVFEKDYKLPKLSEIEAYYTAHGHLPLIPTAQEVRENGIDVAEMNKLLLQKIEELTMLMVEQQKQIDSLKNK